MEGGKWEDYSFLDDIWILDHPLSVDQKWNGFMEQCKNLFRIFVEYYWEENNWLDFKRVDRNLNDLNKILNAIFLSHEEDALIWKYNHNGFFSVSSVYSNDFEEYHEPYWAKAWLKGMTPKVNIFFWILLQEFFLTMGNLLKRGFKIVNRCYLCKKDAESVDHMAIHYYYTRRLWERVCGLLNIIWVFPATI